jgi:hypothetical protein
MFDGPRAQFVDRLRVTYVPRDLKTQGSLLAKTASALHERCCFSDRAGYRDGRNHFIWAQGENKDEAEAASPIAW